MNITTKDELKEITLPFAGFKPNTLILSEQINDNNDEIQYRTNLLIRSFLNHVDQNIELEGLYDILREEFDVYVVDNDDRVLKLETKVDKNNKDLNIKIDDNATKIYKSIDTQKNILETKISEKANALELNKTLLYLKSGDNVLSVADLSSLGGVSGKSTYLAHGHLVTKDNWIFSNEHNLYYVEINHNLNTSLPIVSYYDEETNFNVFDVVENVSSNTVKIYIDEPINTYIAIIDGSGNVNMVQAILDDDDITTYRTWSSAKIRHEIDSKTVDLSPIEDSIKTLEDSIKALEDEIGVNKTTLQSNINAIREVL